MTTTPHGQTPQHAAPQAAREWYRDYFDRRYDELAGRVRTPEAVEAEAVVLRSVLAQHGAHAGRLLDVPCGNGALAIALEECGFEVCGIDLSADMVELARERAAAARARATFVHADARSLPATLGTFRAAFSWFNSLGYSPEPADDLRYLRSVAGRLLPGGLFVIHADHLDGVRARLTDGYGVEFDGGGYRADTRLDGDVLVERQVWTVDGETSERSMRIRFYTRAGLAQLLALAGLEVLEVRAGDGSPEPGDETVITVARRMSAGG
jgi:SAM-dependent methyltransferase